MYSLVLLAVKLNLVLIIIIIIIIIRTENMPAMTPSAQSLDGCVYLWQLRYMDVGVLKHRQTFLDVQRAWQLD